MKILSIGNSFAQDAQRYLHQIAAADGMELTCVNLYIGGCSLQNHYENMKGDRADYALEINGESTGKHISIREALAMDAWDVVTLQQVSNLAPEFSTYMPYLTELHAYVKQQAPTAKIYIHQTWAYEAGSDRLCKELQYKDQKDMFLDVKNAYAKAAETIKADGLIPSGQALQNALEYGIPKVHRDTFHADFGIGRYILGLTWYQTLTGRNIEKNTFDLFDIEVPSAWIAIAKQAVGKLQE